MLIFLASKLEAQPYVTWDDIKVNSNALDLNEEGYIKSQRVIVVDQNGNGDSVTVQGAIDTVPINNSDRIKIFIRPAIYREKVFIPASKPFISLIGDENHPGRAIITWNSKACDKDQYGNELGTINTATVAVESDYFCSSGITIENTVFAFPWEYNKQAVALRLAGDKAMLYKVRVLGSQDTLYDELGSHYFFKCYIEGTVDFICGNATSLYLGCDLHSIAQDNMGITGAIAAHQRDSPDVDSGFSFVKCKVTGSGSVLLGRAWGEYSRIIYSKCYFDGIITPEGWYDWDQSSRQQEKVNIPASKPFISLVGDHNQTARTIISGHDKASDTDQYGSILGTCRSATLTVESDYFCATGITIENTIIPDAKGVGMQAVALRLTGDRSVLYRVRILGSQDTLLDDAGSHYFYQCYIQGSVDFICGNARSLYKNCTLHSIAKGYGAIAAQHRDTASQDTGFSFVNCKISGSGKIFLGRAWGEYSRIIYSKCDIDGIIDPKGWTDWNQPSRRQHAVFGEYQCRGKGANRAGRVAWSKTLNDSEAQQFSDVEFIGGQQWLRL
ncbi:Pectinesterase QRT1 [Capsicum annuum]|uniref:pectinesterase n=1 Tax=Capsicum annuum TaxID=4072 RepID=A0A2G2Z5S3_CAPAN|nr:Pectinesterase QRT1 [Capsicum annuum]